MPFYEYRCQECGREFVVRATIKQKEEGLQPACPLCGCEETRVVMRSPQMLRRRDGARTGSGSGGCCGPGSREGCCR